MINTANHGSHSCCLELWLVINTANHGSHSLHIAHTWSPVGHTWLICWHLRSTSGCWEDSASGASHIHWNDEMCCFSVAAPLPAVSVIACVTLWCCVHVQQTVENDTVLPWCICHVFNLVIDDSINLILAYTVCVCRCQYPAWPWRQREAEWLWCVQTAADDRHTVDMSFWRTDHHRHTVLHVTWGRRRQGIRTQGRHLVCYTPRRFITRPPSGPVLFCSLSSDVCLGYGPRLALRGPVTPQRPQHMSALASGHFSPVCETLKTVVWSIAVVQFGVNSCSPNILTCIRYRSLLDVRHWQSPGGSTGCCVYIDSVTSVSSSRNRSTGPPSLFRHSLSVVCRSFGCTVVEMVTGHPPWHKFEGVAAIFKIATEHPPAYQLPDSSSNTLRNFLEACFRLSVDERPTAGDLLRHAFVSEWHSSVSEWHLSEYAHMRWFNVRFTRGSVSVGTLAFYIRYINEDSGFHPAVRCWWGFCARWCRSALPNCRPCIYRQFIWLRLLCCEFQFVVKNNNLFVTALLPVAVTFFYVSTRIAVKWL